MLLQLLIVLLCIIVGARLGGIGLGVMGGLGVVLLTFVFGLKPTTPPVDVILMIAAVISAAACMQAAGGLDYMVMVAERLLRKHPQNITILAPLVTYTFTFLAGTGHVAYSVLPVISEVARETKIRPERPLGIAVIASQQAITASPISAAMVTLLGLLSGYNITLFDILKISVPATLIGVLVGAFFSMRVGKELVDDPEYKHRLAAGMVEKSKVQETGVVSLMKAKISVALFFVATLVIVLLGSIEGLRPSFENEVYVKQTVEKESSGVVADDVPAEGAAVDEVEGVDGVFVEQTVEKESLGVVTDDATAEDVVAENATMDAAAGATTDNVEGVDGGFVEQTVEIESSGVVTDDVPAVDVVAEDVTMDAAAGVTTDNVEGDGEADGVTDVANTKEIYIKSVVKKKLDMPFIIEMVMLATAALILLLTKADGAKAVKGCIFSAGMQAVVAIFGIAWMGDTFINGNKELLEGAVNSVVTDMPWLFGLALFVMSILLYSQAATVRAIVPLGTVLAISPMMIIALFPAVNGYFFIPNYPTLVAAINFDSTGTTRIGRWVLNHSFMLPGLISTAVAIAVGLLLIQIY